MHRFASPGIRRRCSSSVNSSVNSTLPCLRARERAKTHWRSRLSSTLLSSSVEARNGPREGVGEVWSLQSQTHQCSSDTFANQQMEKQKTLNVVLHAMMVAEGHAEPSLSRWHCYRWLQLRVGGEPRHVRRLQPVSKERVSAQRLSDVRHPKGLGSAAHDPHQHHAGRGRAPRAYTGGRVRCERSLIACRSGAGGGCVLGVCGQPSSAAYAARGVGGDARDRARHQTHTQLAHQGAFLSRSRPLSKLAVESRFSNCPQSPFFTHVLAFCTCERVHV